MMCFRLTEVNVWGIVSAVDNSKRKEVKEKMQDVSLEVKWIPVRSAAKMLKVSRQRVNKMAKIGQLRSVMMDGNRLVSLRAVSEMVEIRARGGGSNVSNR